MAETPQATVRAKHLQTTKSPGIPGVLVMSWNRFTWAPNDPRAGAKLVVDFSTIKAHRFSKETPTCKKALLNLSTDTDPKAQGGYIFEFENFSDRDMCRDHVARVLGKQKNQGPATAAGPSSAPSHAASQHEQLSRAEMERRMKLLQDNFELQKLHQRLVISGVLSESEFWEGRKHMLENNAAARPRKQRTGLKTQMLTVVRPEADGRSNKVTFNLTPEIIHQIFAEKPAVHRAFLTSVPAKMTELVFWEKYFRAEFLYQKSAAAAAAEAADDEDLAVFVKDDDILANQAFQKIKKVDPTVDIAADLADDYSSVLGHGILRDGNKEPSTAKNQSRKNLAYDLNRHAAVVLEGRPLDEELVDTQTVAHALARSQEGLTTVDEEQVKRKRAERVHEMTEIEDLQGPHGPSTVPLIIQDTYKYFDLQEANSLKSTSSDVDPHKILASFRLQFQDVKEKGLKDPIIDPELAIKVLNDVTKKTSSIKHPLGKIAEKNVLDSLPRPVRDDLMQHSAASKELLRHFWATYPITSKLYSDKANHFKEAMTKLYNELQLFKESASSEHRHQLSLLLQPILQAMDAAFSHYEAEAERRAAKAQKSFSAGSFHNGL